MKSEEIKYIPQGYKDSPLGFIPEEWEIVEFEKIATLSHGKHNPINENLPCLELEHFEQGTGNILGWINSSEQKSIKNKFKEGDILFGKLRPYLQKYWLAKFDGVCSSEVWVFKNSNKCSNKFLFRLIQTNRFIQTANVSSGSKMPRADWDYVASYPFALPPLPEQQKIAEILTVWDNAIDIQAQLIASLQKRKHGLMQQLLTGKKRLEGFEGEWKEVKLGDVIKIKKGKALTSDQIIDGIYPVIAGGKTSPYSHNEYTDENVITISASGAYAGYVSYHTNKIWASDCSVLYAKMENNTIYIYYLLIYNQEFIYLLQSGGAQPHIFPKDIAVIKCKIPPLAEQIAIANILSAADKEIDLTKKKLTSLKEQKKGLMQQLLTGKKRVKIN